MNVNVDTPELDEHAVRRRSILRAAVAAGVTAWTAPVILDSVTSPAAAMTLPPGLHGCHFILFNGGNCNPDNQGTPCNLIPGCVQSDLLADALEVIPSGGKCQDAGVIVNNKFVAEGCAITAAYVKAGDDCYTPAQTIGGSMTAAQVVWGSAPNGKTFNQFAIFLTCP